MYKRKSVKTRDRRGERGTVLAAAALGMLSFLMAVGLGLDISHMYLAKTELQNAADAAALAGASGLDTSPAGIGRATNRAKAEMNKYEFDNTSIGLTAVNVRFGKNLSDFANGTDLDSVAAASTANAPAVRFVKVTTPDKPINIAFVSMVLGSTVDLKAEAVAGMSVPLTSYSGYLPVSVVDDDSLSTIKPGQMYTFRGGPQGSVSPGNYQILAIDGSGAADDRTGLATGVRNVVGSGGYVDTKPGVSAGAVRQGVNTRFDDYASGMDPIDYPPDTNIKEGISYADYLAGSPSQPPRAGHDGVFGRRVVLIPIIKKSQFDGGRTRVQIDHFGAFFLRSKVQGGNGGDIQAEYIGVAVVVGSGEYDPDSTPAPGPAITKPVLYR